MQDVLVIGGSLSGLACASSLAQQGLAATVLEAAAGGPWAQWAEAAWQALPAAAAAQLRRPCTMDIRFGFHVDRVSRIDGSGALVAWCGDRPVLGRMAVLATRPAAWPWPEGTRTGSDIVCCERSGEDAGGGALAAVLRGQRAARAVQAMAMAGVCKQPSPARFSVSTDPLLSAA